MKNVLILSLLFTMIFTSCKQEPIYLVIRGDDMGFCHVANIACIDAYKKGIMTSVEVLVPGPDFQEAADLLKDNQGLDVGIHLCLTSEWNNHKWGPLTAANTCVDSMGYFLGATEALLALDFDTVEVKKELKAQMDTALKYIPQISHVSSHMFWPGQDKRLEHIFTELSKEYNLPVDYEIDNYGFFWGTPANKKMDALVDYLEKIKTGINIFIMHPGYNQGDMKIIKGEGLDPNVNMAIHRQAVTEAVTNDLVKSIISKRNIKLVSYADLYNLK